jgi:hypothetical protein
MDRSASADTTVARRVHRWCASAALAGLLLAGDANAQDPIGDPAESTGPAESATRSIDAVDPVDAVAGSAEGAASDPLTEALEAARRAEQAAEEARGKAYEANRATLLLEARLRELEQTRAYDRPGFVAGAYIFYAPEAFDYDVGDSDAGGIGWRLGYRFNPYVSGDLRFDLLSEFDASGNVARGTVAPWALTANARVYWPIGWFQPYASMGLGAASARIKGTRFGSGTAFSVRETDIVFRGGGGFDVYVSPHVVLNFDTAYYAPGGELGDFAFGAIGGGIELRF